MGCHRILRSMFKIRKNIFINNMLTALHLWYVFVLFMYIWGLYDIICLQEKKKKSAEELTQMQEGMKKLQDRMVVVSVIILC